MTDEREERPAPWPAGEGGMAACIRAHDWAATPLGPVADWPQPLRTAVELMLGAPQGALVAWGPELAVLYNDFIAGLLGDRHPWGLGRPLRTLWPDPEIGHLIDGVLSGATQRVSDMIRDIPSRAGSPRGWFSGNWTPLRDESGRIGGIYATGTETTGRVLAARALRTTAARQAFLLKIADALRPLDGPVAVATAACRLLAGHLGASRVEYVEVGDEGGAELPGLRVGYSDLPGPALIPHPLEGLGDEGAAALRRGEPVVLRGGRGDAGRLAAPVIKGGRLAACLVLRDATPRDWTADETTLVQAVAERIWTAVERARVKAALRASEERYRTLAELVPVLLWQTDPSGNEASTNTGWLDYTGHTSWQAQNGGWLEAIHPDDRDRTARAFAAAHADRQPLRIEHRIRRRDGVYCWHQVHHRPLRNAQGAVTAWLGAAIDIDDQRRTLDRLRGAELRLHTLIEGMPQLVWRAGNGGCWTWSSPQWTAFTGQPMERSIGFGWLEALHPDDRGAAMRLWDAAAGSGRLEMEGRIFHAADRGWRWFQTRATPIRDSDGAIIEWLGTSTDIHDLRELQERQRLLVAELQHRTRNLLGVVRSLADRTAQSSAGLADFRTRFHDRLAALARVQGLLSRLDEHDRVTFGDLIRTELSAMGASFDRVTLQGPEGVRLRSSTVQMLALALHELATNAVKYGALGQPAARLAIAWTFEPGDEGGDPWLHIDWRESGVVLPDPVNPPSGGGQGRELIEQALPYQLGARTRFVLGPGGLDCTISLPVSASVAGPG